MGDKVTSQTVGYSGTPLAKKLGIKSGFKLKVINAPDNYLELFTDLPDHITFVDDSNNDKIEFVHFFTKDDEELIANLPALKDDIKPNGIIWVSWPKKASKVATTVGEELVRNYALKIGLVDVKICSVDHIWSGLKLVIPVKDRGEAHRP